MRERAAAILKIAKGDSGREVALHGLLKPHWQDTIYQWVERYRAKGKADLEIKTGRGRKPASPRYPNEEEAREAILHMLHQSPKELGQFGTRWKLQSLLGARKWLCLKSLASL